MKAAVILGNRMNDDGSMSGRMLIRLNAALKLYAEKKPDYIIVSGGLANKTAGVTEAAAMKNWLVERGVPSDIIVEEDKSLTTKQNAEFAVPMALKLGAEVIYLCSSKEHIRRIYLNPVRLFKKKLKGESVSLGVYSD